MENSMIVIRPQPRQEIFLQTSADIAIYGGSAGGGKSFACLLEPLRHVNNPNYGAVIFRRTIPEIVREGALWDEAGKIYPLLGAKPNNNEHTWIFPSGARIAFSHMQLDRNALDWKGAQIPTEIFDQLEMFTEFQFWYMLSRNRSTCGVIPYVRATVNPEPGWLANFLSWWIDDDGWAIPERSGVVRWMVREGDEIKWADSRDEAIRKYGNIHLKADDPDQAQPKSVTFILATIYDNQELLKKDPSYLANLKALSLVDRQRLLGDAKRGGNWKIKPSAGHIFNRSWFEIVDAVPFGGREVRFYDLAATEQENKTDDPDFTASVKGKIVDGVAYILDVTNERIDPAMTNSMMKNRATQDTKKCAIRWEKEGGASGKRDSYHITTLLQGYDTMGITPQGDKIVRAKPLAAQALAGNVKLLRASWNEMFLEHMHGQPDFGHDDIMDAASGMYNELAGDYVVGAWGR